MSLMMLSDVMVFGSEMMQFEEDYSDMGEELRLADQSEGEEGEEMEEVEEQSEEEGKEKEEGEKSMNAKSDEDAGMVTLASHRSRDDDDDEQMCLYSPQRWDREKMAKDDDQTTAISMYTTNS